MTDTDQPPATLAASLALVQSQLPKITKDKTAQVRSDKGNYSYSYADLAAVTAEVLPLLGRCGLAWVTRPTFNDEGRFVLAYQLLHAAGETIDGEYPLPGSGTPQAMGSAITYARRYTLCSVTGVAPDTDDDDAAHATEQARPGQKTTVRRQRQESEPSADARPTRPVQRRPPPPRQGGLPPLPGEEQAQQPSRESVTPPQLAKIGTVFTSLGVKGDGSRAERLRISSSIVGRELTTSKDLTKDEARTLIDTLEGANPEQLAELLIPEPAASGDPWAGVDPTQPAPDDTDDEDDAAELDLDTDGGDE